jgi:hypothetical protein
MTTSILEQDYIKPDRPYSQSELKYNIDSIFRSMRLGKIRVHHQKCNHFYYVKENGRKEKDIKESNSNDVGNCSVCWKFNKTPSYLKNSAHNMINEYNNRCYITPEYLSYENIDLEITFLKWLYKDGN